MGRILVIVLSGLIAAGCGEPKHSELGPRGIGTAEKVSDQDFAILQDQILSVSCVGCHKQMKEKEYVIRNASKILAAVVSDEMPQDAPPLSDDLKALLVVVLGE